MVHKISKIDSLSWKEARQEVRNLNSTLADIIDQVSPNPTHKLFRISYPYGFEIFQKGELQLPQQNHPTPREEKIREEIKSALNYYDGVPIGLILKNSAESYLTFQDRIMTYSRYDEGDIIGLNRLLNEDLSHISNSNLWGMTAGAKSTFMLPKISDENSHARLKDHYQFKQSKPLALRDHWNIFKLIANSPAQTQNPWSVDLLFFGKEWFEHRNDPSWSQFYLYMLETAWTKTAYWRNQYFLNTIASVLQEETKMKVSLYEIELVMHIVAIGLGALPGFRVANNNKFLPHDLLQDAYANVYNLREYEPLIMEPAYFSFDDQTPSPPAYYSLNYPSCLHFSTKNSKKSSNVHDLYDVGRILKRYLDKIQNGGLGIEKSLIAKLADTCKFNLFHNAVGDFTSVLESKLIETLDPNFMAHCADKKGASFPKSSLFFNGCIMISRDQNTQ